MRSGAQRTVGKGAGEASTVTSLRLTEFTSCGDSELQATVPQNCGGSQCCSVESFLADEKSRDLQNTLLASDEMTTPENGL